MQVRHEEIENTPFNIHVEEGDQVLVWAIIENGKIADAYIADYARDRYLKFLVGAFILLLAVMGGKKGIKAIITLALTALAIMYILLPLMLKGYNPIALTVLISAAVTVVTFIIISGFTRKTLIAVVGTVVGVIIAGLLAYYVGTFKDILPDRRIARSSSKQTQVIVRFSMNSAAVVGRKTRRITPNPLFNLSAAGS